MLNWYNLKKMNIRDRTERKREREGKKIKSVFVNVYDTYGNDEMEKLNRTIER